MEPLPTGRIAQSRYPGEGLAVPQPRGECHRFSSRAPSGSPPEPAAMDALPHALALHTRRPAAAALLALQPLHRPRLQRNRRQVRVRRPVPYPVGAGLRLRVLAARDRRQRRAGAARQQHRQRVADGEQSACGRGLGAGGRLKSVFGSAPPLHRSAGRSRQHIRSLSRVPQTSGPGGLSGLPTRTQMRMWTRQPLGMGSAARPRRACHGASTRPARLPLCRHSRAPP
jgi:hypothetical protein